MNKAELFINHDAALDVIRAEPDKIVQTLLLKADTLVIRAFWEGRRAPSLSFDCLFFIATLQELFTDKNRIQEILDGKFNSWFEDDD